MRDVMSAIDRWQAEEYDVALATVIETWGSAPRRVGAKMALANGSKIAGSVSGGCVEGAVYETGVTVLREGIPQLLHFGVADETAWDVGLACGGTIDVFVEKLDPSVYANLRDLVQRDQLFATVTVISGDKAMLGKKLIVHGNGRRFGSIDPRLDELAAEVAQTSLAAGRSERLLLKPYETAEHQVEIFVEINQPAPGLVIVGGVHIAIALTTLAKTLAYRTTIVDPRRAFGNVERFPNVDQLIQLWPDKAFQEINITSSTAVATLTHDPKIDDPALRISLASPAFYVGALGSRRTHERRLKRLAAAGLSDEQLSRIHGPIGLDIGAQTPEEIALAIMAQIVAARTEQ